MNANDRRNIRKHGEAACLRAARRAAYAIEHRVEISIEGDNLVVEYANPT